MLRNHKIQKGIILVMTDILLFTGILVKNICTITNSPRQLMQMQKM